MTHPIYFNVEQARNQLSLVGWVYTLRKKRRTGTAIARQGSYYRWTRLGQVRILDVNGDNPSPEFLKGLVAGSGFSSLDDWLAHAPKGWNRVYEVRRVGKW